MSIYILLLFYWISTIKGRYTKIYICRWPHNNIMLSFIYKYILYHVQTLATLLLVRHFISNTNLFNLFSNEI